MGKPGAREKAAQKVRRGFTLYHGFAVSLVIHAALALPLVLYAWAFVPDDEDTTLVIDLSGVVTDSQVEQKAVQQIKGAATPEDKPPKVAAAKAPPSETPPTDDPAPAVSMQAPAPPDDQQKPADTNNVRGVEEQRTAQTIKPQPQVDVDPLQLYVKVLAKKIEANLVYPEAGRHAGLQGTAAVSFAVLSDGQIRPGSLKIVESSGQPKLDASALATIRACAPFAAPPSEMTVAIAVAYGRKR